MLDGAHEPIVSWELFEQVQAQLARNSGRSRTLDPRPAREYLLKGLIRCASCGLPLWAQTYKNGHSNYREHRGSRGTGGCNDVDRSIPCEVANNEVSNLIGGLALPADWMERALERVSLSDEVKRVRFEREQMQDRLRRLGTAFVDGLVDEADYRRHKEQLEFELAALRVPEAEAIDEAGRLIHALPERWSAFDMPERRQLLLSILDAVYIDPHATPMVSLRFKSAFRAVLATREAAGGRKQ